MLDLDNLERFQELDTLDMYTYIHDLPEQLETAWAEGARHALPAVSSLKHVVLAGMGGSAIGADLLAAYGEPLAQIPVTVLRDYSLPAWAAGSETLVICLSHSGNTEETRSVFQQALERRCTQIAITTGGQLAAAAGAAGVPVWTFQHKGQPRSAVGFSFGLLLAAFARLGILPDPSQELESAVAAMRLQQEKLVRDVPVVKNPAKRQAGQLMNRWVTVMGAEHLAPVARRWKGQVSEIAKAWAQFEFLPEANHNTQAGTVFPEEQLSRMITIFLRAPSYHPRNLLRTNLTRQSFMMEGFNTDLYEAQGETRLAHIWTALHFGDYMAFYLAMAYGVDPTPVPALEQFKAAMLR